jgi:hypothetical protein
MNKKEQVINSLREVVKGETITFTATVNSVDQNNASCEVTDPNGLVFYDVRLRSAIDGNTTGLVVYPAPGSSVIVGRIGKSNQLFVINYSDVQLFTLKSQNESLKQLLIDLLDAINQITVTTGTGPSGVPINAPAFTAIKQRLNNIFKE